MLICSYGKRMMCFAVFNQPSEQLLRMKASILHTVMLSWGQQHTGGGTAMINSMWRPRLPWIIYHWMEAGRESDV